MTLDPAGGWLNPETPRHAPLTVLFVWALSCALCKAQMPLVRRMQADPGVRLLTVHTPIRDSDHDRTRLADVARSFALTAPIALDDDGAIADALSVRGLPAWFVFGPRGLQVMAAGAGADRQVEEALRLLTTEAVAP